MIWDWLRIDCYDVLRATVTLANTIEFASRIAELLGGCDVKIKERDISIWWMDTGLHWQRRILLWIVIFSGVYHFRSRPDSPQSLASTVLLSSLEHLYPTITSHPRTPPLTTSPTFPHAPHPTTHPLTPIKPMTQHPR